MSPRMLDVGCRAVHRLGGRLVPPALFARTHPGIPGRIHIDDQMLRSDAPEHVRHYLEDARSAMLNLEESLAAAHRTFDDVRACLDFASGYGRVTRHLVARLGGERVTVCDVDRQALRFCAREFGVRTLGSPRAGLARRCPEAFDLIFVGSLLTHLESAPCLDVVHDLHAVLRPGGVLVFSTQGESCLDHLSWYGEHFLRAEPTFRARVARDGVCFVAYPWRRRYGVTIHARRYVEAMMREHFADRLRLVRYRERGWDAHQDVWSYQAV